MVRRSSSPVPDDPVQSTFSSNEYVRARDGNPVPSAAELKLFKRTLHRTLSPSILPGVRPLPRDVSATLKDQLVPGSYYAKSMTQYLGPFDHEPNEDELPGGDTYFILQSMGRMASTGKSVFRHVRHITTPAKKRSSRPISPSELPGVRCLNTELDDEARQNLVPGQYYAKSMTRYLGPFESIPSLESLPPGESYVILQEMGHIPTGSVFRRVTQIDR